MMPSSQDEMNEQEPMEGAGLDGSAAHEGMEGEAPEAEDNSPSESEPITAAGVRAKMKFPKGMEKAYVKVVKAGLQLMFDPSTREDTMAFMEEAGADSDKMAEGVSAVVLTLFQESNETIPPNLLIPAGIELLVHAVEVAKAGGAKVSNEQLAEGMGNMVEQILVKFGATPEQMQKLMSGMDSGQAAPQAPQGGGMAPAPAGGLVGGAMAQGV